MGEAFEALEEELAARFRQGVEPWPEEVFDGLARRVFAFQYENNPVYRRFCDARDASPARWRERGGWRGIPPVPTRAFKHLRLVSGSAADVERVFTTSGTTRGSRRRGEHAVRSLDLYRASLLPNARARLFPDGARLPVVSLTPDPARVPGSSLGTMVEAIGTALGRGVRWCFDAEGGVRHDDLWESLETAEAEGTPVLVAATAFALVQALDAAAAAGRSVRLPEGSRVVETGGFKGRSRRVERRELYDGVAERWGVGEGWIVNEYGMTELLSQFWEPVLGADPPPALDARRHVPPPWLRTLALDPASLEPLPMGARGLLCHLDLANLGSVAAVLTEDVGVLHPGGLEVLGRAEGAEPRGCSLAVEDLLEAADRTPTSP